MIHKKSPIKKKRRCSTGSGRSKTGKTCKKKVISRSKKSPKRRPVKRWRW